MNWTPPLELEQLNPRQFERFRDFIYETSGIRIDDRKLSLLSNRIRRRLRAGDFADFDAYYAHLTSRRGRPELECFLDAITTNETFFFRSPTHFEWLKDDFIAELVREERAGRRERSLRIWSAGCASGAEPASIAICLLENRFRLRDWEITILGTDLSEDVLRSARAGVFRARAVEGVSEQQRKRYLHQRDDEEWELKKTVSDLVTFEQHNLLAPLPHPPFDCIFIRNVLIYFDRDSKQRVLANLLKALAPGGYLVVGPSEGIYDMLEPLERRTTFLYQRPKEPASA
jgi:chemotaxis protein methyltransferase CheR